MNKTILILAVFLISLILADRAEAAIDATTIWEFRADNGAADNGGGYANLDPGTSVDYSDQDAAEITFNDGATAGIGNTTLTSVSTPFTAAMAGNVIYLQTGVNLTDGWYQITVFTDTGTVTLDRAPDDGVGAMSSGDGKVGGALDILTDTFLDDDDVVIAGNTIYIKDDGTMTLGGNIDVTTHDGTSALPITIEGYNSSRGDDPTGTNRPLIAAGANEFKFGDYWSFKNIRLTITENNGFWIENYCTVYNCLSTSGGTYTFYGGTYTHFIDCEANANNVGFSVGGYGGAIGCYAHGGTGNGFKSNNGGEVYINCIADTMDKGITIGNKPAGRVIGCTIYNCTTSGINGSAVGCIFLNNIIDGCGTGAAWDSEIKSNLWDYNCWDNTSDVSNVTKGDNAVTGDPGMTDPANEDFTLGGGSNCLDVGLQFTGIVAQGTLDGDYKVNIGADQDDVAGGGGNPRHGTKNGGKQ